MAGEDRPSPVIVDNTDPSIRYSPPDLWTPNEICVACNVSRDNQFVLRQRAFNSTWHTAPGARFPTSRNMTIEFDFSGTSVTVWIVLFRRTDNRGNTLDDGKSGLRLTLDGDRRTAQIIPLTLAGWTNQQLREQFRFMDLFASAPSAGKHTLKLEFSRDNALEIPVTFGLDYLRFTPLPSPNPDFPTTETPSTSPSTETSTSTTSSETAPQTGEPSTSGKTTDVGRIVGSVVGLVLALVALVILLLCWRQRRLKRHQRLKASIRRFKPVTFETYYQQTPYSFYMPQSPVDVEKPPPSLPSPFPRRVSIGPAPSASATSTVEPIASGNGSFYQRWSSLTFSSFSAPARPQSRDSYEEQWRHVAASKQQQSSISTGATGGLPVTQNPGHPPFVVVNK